MGCGVQGCGVQGCGVGCELLASPASQALRLAAEWQWEAAPTVGWWLFVGTAWALGGPQVAGRRLRGCAHTVVIRWAWEPLAVCSREAPWREEQGRKPVNGDDTD